MTTPLVLASASPFRRMLLENAGLIFEVLPAAIDERAVERPLEEIGASPEKIALVLAEAKALSVSEHAAGKLVIGSDQTMSLNARVYHKPADMDEARRHLLSLSGRTHQLNSGVALARDGKLLWSHMSSALLGVRVLTPEFVDRHLARVGPSILGSVGAYQLEGEGLQLFDTVEGDYFTILGLPMLPLLAKLREFGGVDA